MRVDDVRGIAEAAQVDPAYYSLDGDRHEALCLLAIGQQWHVFLSERGTRFENQAFDTEDEACTYFLKTSSGFGGQGNGRPGSGAPTHWRRCRRHAFGRR